MADRPLAARLPAGLTVFDERALGLLVEILDGHASVSAERLSGDVRQDFAAVWRAVRTGSGSGTSEPVIEEAVRERRHADEISASELALMLGVSTSMVRRRCRPGGDLAAHARKAGRTWMVNGPKARALAAERGEVVAGNGQS